MRNMPLVSVIITFLNAEKFLNEAIDSVFAQTYKNWELLLVDDGSTDRSTDTAVWYSNHYPEQVRYLEHENHKNCGRSASRNLGIRKAGGKFVAFLDSDDVYLPQKLETQVSILESHPSVDMTYGTTKNWFSWTGKHEDLERDYIQDLRVPTYTVFHPPRLLNLLLQHKLNSPGPSRIMLRQSAIGRIGSFEDDFMGLFEDQVLIAKFFLKSNVYVHGGCYDLYRRHPDSLSEVMIRRGEYDPDGKPNNAYQEYLLWLEKYLDEQRITDHELRKSLSKQLRPYKNPLSRKFYLITHELRKIKRKLEKPN